MFISAIAHRNLMRKSVVKGPWLIVIPSFFSLALSQTHRTLKKINSLLDLINSFPRQNQLDDDVVALLDRIRGKFKTVASALQTAERYADAPKSKMFY